MSTRAKCTFAFVVSTVPPVTSARHLELAVCTFYHFILCLELREWTCSNCLSFLVVESGAPRLLLSKLRPRPALRVWRDSIPAQFMEKQVSPSRPGLDLVISTCTHQASLGTAGAGAEVGFSWPHSRSHVLCSHCRRLETVPSSTDPEVEQEFPRQ